MSNSLADEDIFSLLTSDTAISEPDRLEVALSDHEDEPSTSNQNNFVEEEDDLSDADSEVSSHNTESEVNISDCSDDSESENEQSESEEPNPGNYFYGKNRYKWAKTPPASSRTRITNILHIPQVIGPAKTNKPRLPLDAWSLLFSEEIIEKVLEHTNEKITSLSFNYKSLPSFAGHVDIIELKSFLGLLILSGTLKSGHEDVCSLFASDGTGRDIFRATMSLKRFLFLLIALRFDDQSTREDRKAAGDRLAPISDIFNLFMSNCTQNYACGEYSTVDEHMIPFKGRCKFRMYLKNKPKKFGLKVMCLCDARTGYLIDAFVYCGKENDPNPRKLNVPTQNVFRLTSSIQNSNRNVTGDNWFSSLQLVEELRSKGLTYVGTMRRNKREIPRDFLPNKNRTVGSSIFGFTRNNTLVSHVPKRSKSVILVSSMHHSNTINATSNKPEIIEFYNLTKGGVDSFDQKCAVYSCQRRTRRWPAAVFFGMVDMSRVNSYILLRSSNSDVKMNHREFSIALGKSLVQSQLERRAVMQTIPRDLKLIIQTVAVIELRPSTTPERPAKRKRCDLCPRKNDKKIKTTCQKCSSTVCKDHSTMCIICNNCSK